MNKCENHKNKGEEQILQQLLRKSRHCL